MRYHPDYTVTISCPDRFKEPIRAPLAESFDFDTTASYEPVFGAGSSGMITNSLRLMGIRPTFQAATMQLWQGSVESPLSVKLEFIAETDAYTDVIVPINNLNMLCAAHMDKNGFLTAPAGQIGESIISQLASIYNGDSSGAPNGSGQTTTNDATSTYDANQNSNRTKEDGTARVGTKEWLMQYITNKVTIQIGRKIFFDCVVPITATQTFSTQPDENGYCSHAVVNLQFRPMFMLTAQDIGKIFHVQTEPNAQQETPPGPESYISEPNPAFLGTF